MLSLMDTVLGRHSVTANEGGLLRRVNTAMALHRSRARLAELEPHMLADIGLDAAAARAEAGRPVWDAPEAWKR